MPEKQVHIDLETLGLKPRARILSIGAVWVHHEFYVELDTDQYTTSPFFAEADTVQWWADRGGFQPTTVTLHTPAAALQALARWFESIGFTENDTVWAKFPQFDCTKLCEHFDYFGVPRPWQFWQERDMKTVWEVGRAMHLNLDKPSAPHHALEDAKLQRDAVDNVYYVLGRLIQAGNNALAAEVPDDYIYGDDPSTCEHEWVSSNNQDVVQGEWCKLCGFVKEEDL